MLSRELLLQLPHQPGLNLLEGSAEGAPHHCCKGGGLLRRKEGNCDLRSSATVEVLPEDSDQAGEGAGEEVLWKACRVHRPEENPAQANQEDQQVEAKEAQVPDSAGRAHRYP